MKQSLLNKIAGVGLISTILIALCQISMAIANKNDHFSAVPISYKVGIIILCWLGIDLIGVIIYFSIKRFIK